MSRRRPWEEPIQYNEDRFPENQNRFDQADATIKPDPDLMLSRVHEAQQGKPTPPANRPRATRDKAPSGPIDSGPRSSGNPRPSWRDGVANRSNDDAPLNYNRGPHDGELDVDDRDEID